MSYDHHHQLACNICPVGMIACVYWSLFSPSSATFSYVCTGMQKHSANDGDDDGGGGGGDGGGNWPALGK